MFQLFPTGRDGGPLVFGIGIANARPHILCRGFGNNFCVDKCVHGRPYKKFGFKNVPSSLYMMDTEVQAAQLEAMVGNVKTGLSSVIHRHFTVSSAFPPPTPKTISAL